MGSNRKHGYEHHEEFLDKVDGRCSRSNNNEAPLVNGTRKLQVTLVHAGCRVLNSSDSTSSK